MWSGRCTVNAIDWIKRFSCLIKSDVLFTRQQVWLESWSLVTILIPFSVSHTNIIDSIRIQYILMIYWIQD